MFYLCQWAIIGGFCAYSVEIKATLLPNPALALLYMPVIALLQK